MKRLVNSLQDFFKLESASGIILIISVALALIVYNSPLQESYNHLLHSQFDFNLLGLSIEGKDFHYFVNDGLMPIFFFLIGLEVKREFISGELKEPKKVLLPALAALFGLLVPIVIYKLFNDGTIAESGWSIPAATDIAIAFGVLLMLGSRIPNSLKVFLMMLAIFDDLLVIGIIAVFFTETIDLNYILMTLFCCLILFGLNKKNVSNFAPFAILGFFLWYFVLKSGIHATIAGIILAIFIPSKPREIEENGRVVEKEPMLTELEHSLHEFVSFLVLPVFAFINSGVLLSMEGFTGLTSNLSLGIILGLFVGKQIGIFGISFALIKLKIVSMPKDANLMQLYGVSILCGIGFTMGLFIGDLAFEDPNIMFKLPILVASTLSAVVGYVVLYLSTQKKE